MEIKTIKKNEDVSLYEELREVWAEVFGDSREEVDEFYDILDATGYVLEDDGKAQSFLTVYSTGKYLDEKPSINDVSVIYAVCTRPESRGKGYAGKLVERAKADIEGSGGIAILCPATASLVDYYQKLGFRPAFYACERTVPRSDMTVTITRLNKEQYARLRKAFLDEYAVIELGNELIQIAEYISYNADGFIMINNAEAIGIICNVSDEEVQLYELLANPNDDVKYPPNLIRLASGIANYYNTENCFFRMPAYSSLNPKTGERTCHNAYIQAMSGTEIEMRGAIFPYYGLPLE